MSNMELAPQIKNMFSRLYITNKYFLTVTTFKKMFAFSKYNLDSKSYSEHCIYYWTKACSGTCSYTCVCK